MAEITIQDLDAATTPLNPTDLLPLVQGGVTSRTTLAALIAAVFGKISVTENANGTSIRIPGPNLQICWARSEQTSTTGTEVGSVFQTASVRWDFPQAFAGAPVVFANPENSQGNSISARTQATSPTKTEWRLYGATNNSRAYVDLLAIGKY